MDVLIIDDEKQAREGVKILLKHTVEIDQIHEAKDGEEAIEKINDLKPDLIFLDVQMPGINGFDVLASISVSDFPAVIFITAYDQYALKAFEVQALDYLLKPLSEERFQVAIYRAIKHIESKAGSDHNKKLELLIEDYKQEHQESTLIYNRRNTQMIVKAAGKIHFVKTGQVIWIEAMDSYVKIHLEDKTFIVKASMKSIEQRYANIFIRIHRSYLVNMDSIQYLEPSYNGDFFVMLTGDIQLKGSRKFRTNLPEIL